MGKNFIKGIGQNVTTQVYTAFGLRALYVGQIQLRTM